MDGTSAYCGKANVFGTKNWTELCHQACASLHRRQKKKSFKINSMLGGIGRLKKYLGHVLATDFSAAVLDGMFFPKRCERELCYVHFSYMMHFCSGTTLYRYTATVLVALVMSYIVRGVLPEFFSGTSTNK